MNSIVDVVLDSPGWRCASCPPSRKFLIENHRRHSPNVRYPSPSFCLSSSLERCCENPHQGEDGSRVDAAGFAGCRQLWGCHPYRRRSKTLSESTLWMILLGANETRCPRECSSIHLKTKWCSPAWSSVFHAAVPVPDD